MTEKAMYRLLSMVNVLILGAIGFVVCGLPSVCSMTFPGLISAAGIWVVLGVVVVFLLFRIIRIAPKTLWKWSFVSIILYGVLGIFYESLTLPFISNNIQNMIDWVGGVFALFIYPVLFILSIIYIGYAWTVLSEKESE